mgnify:CR=1 FL=1
MSDFTPNYFELEVKSDCVDEKQAYLMVDPENSLTFQHPTVGSPKLNSIQVETPLPLRILILQCISQ